MEDPAAAYRSKISDFRILRELGSGSWGTVYEAERLADCGVYALKKVQMAQRSRRDQMAAVQEAQMLASLDSQYIVKYYDSFLDGQQGHLYICQEYCGGGSLQDAIAASPRPLPETTIWRVLLSAACALHHMHSRRMLHRDVKSANILLSGPLEGGRPPRIILGDLGIARVLEAGRHFASTVLGTPYYMAPEIVQEKPYDAKSDCWALGVTLYECATRRHPFDAQTQPSLILKILRGRFDPVLGLSPNLTAIIHRCLSQAAARRPSMASLLAMPAVRAKAAELGFDLPPLQALGAAGGSSAAALAAARAAAGPGMVRPPPRRATCPEGGPEGDPAMRRVTATGERQRKPPLPVAATPSRRQTVQEGPSAPGAVPSRRRTVQVGADVAAGPAPRPLADSLSFHQGVRLAPAPASPERRRSRGGGSAEPSPERRRSQGGQVSPERRRSQGGEAAEPRRQTESHFSVKRWLRPGAPVADAPAVADAHASVAVQRSAKSEGQLPAALAPERPAVWLVGQAGTIAEEDEEQDNKAAAAEAAAQQAVQLRQRLLAVLGGDAALLERWHGLARAAVEAENSGTTGGAESGAAGAVPAAAGSGRPTMAALTDEVFGHLDMSCAAEALHLLLRVLALEEEA